MFSPRIIPVLLYRNGGLVKSVRFKDHKYIGDPINAVRIFNESMADEIVILDIEASKKGTSIDLDLVKTVGEEANMPFAVGGGIRTLDQIYQVLKNGAEKAVINAAAIKDPEFVRQAADNFGSSTITVCIDIKKNLFGRYQVYSHSDKKTVSKDYVDYISQIADAGAGEIIVQSVDQDGVMKGYDKTLYGELSRKIEIPLLALGGAGRVDDMKELWESTEINSFCAGSMFVYFGAMKGVLINYPKIKRNEFREKFKR